MQKHYMNIQTNARVHKDSPDRRFDRLEYLDFLDSTTAKHWIYIKATLKTKHPNFAIGKDRYV